MNFSLKPTLEHIALVHVTATLWNTYDIRCLLKVFAFSKVEVDLPNTPCYLEKKEEWKAIKNIVKKKVSQLMISTILKEKILSFIEPTGLQILIWLEYHCKYFSLDPDLPKEFYWTPQGTIDKKKTVSVLINDESINIITRYKLACIYCLEHDILKLWNEIPESHRKIFYNEENPSKIEQQELVVFWTYFIKGEIARMDRMIEEKHNRKYSFYRYAFKCAVDAVNKDATNFFLQKLTSRKKSLVNAAISVAKTRFESVRYYNSIDTPKDYFTDVLCFLLSQMNVEQQIEVFKSQPHRVLESLLDWPWHSIFPQTARHLWEFVPGIFRYNILLRLIIEKEKNDYTDFNHQQMFGKLWQQIPDTVKSSLIRDNKLIYMLLRIKDEENIKLIFQTASVIVKSNLIFSKRGRRICEYIIHYGEGDLLKFFIQVCISSKDEIIRFKKEFQEHILHCPLKITRFGSNNILVEFYKLLDDFICQFDKRKSSDENENSPAKRLCKS